MVFKVINLMFQVRNGKVKGKSTSVCGLEEPDIEPSIL